MTLPFVSRERRLLKSEGLIQIRIEDGYRELESASTGHRWVIHKQATSNGYRVILYHKHKATDEYYHRHAIKRRITGAIKEIHDHDLYVNQNNQ